MQGPQGSDGVVGRRRPTGRRGRVVATAVIAALSLGAAACGSSGTTAASTTTAVTFNPATESTDIGAAYNTLFNLANPDVAGKVAVIQNGAQVQSALQDALSSSLASSSAGSKIDSVKVLTATTCRQASLPSPCAKVVYDILGTTGTAILPNSQGYAVFVDGHWLVAKATICGLLGLFYQAAGKTGSPTGC
ncbi:MAG TPA: hypothetical protein VMV22_12270 [Acidimicrobiales bacterium]|nr:hypothetical protein [Acidimicrobiales bacterium]